MNIALIGHGAMGKMVETLAVGAGHHITVIVSEHHSNLPAAQLAETISTAKVAIDFSAFEAVRRNVEACMLAGVPIVEGTTGWNGQQAEIVRLVEEHNGAMVYGANFSIGVDLFYRIAAFASELLRKFAEYEPFIEEQHHSRKKDAPSGTALKLKDIVGRHIDKDVSVAATRAGNIPGTHRVGFDGPADQIVLAHTARSREGFASGAMLAAEWIRGKTGVFEFGEVMNELSGDKG